MMKSGNSLGMFLVGLFSGVILILTIFYFLLPENCLKTFKYVKLKQDMLIENEGFLKKGTIIRIDKPMDEGFTRCVLYLNLKTSETTEVFQTKHFQEVIPYWLESVDYIR